MSKSVKKIKEPVGKGVADVPVIMQMEALECGAACLTMVLAYYEKWIPLEKVRVDCGVSRDGSNAGNVLKAARFYGLEADGYKLEVQTLMPLSSAFLEKVKAGSLPPMVSQITRISGSSRMILKS